jgi:hypothetical protein
MLRIVLRAPSCRGVVGQMDARSKLGGCESEWMLLSTPGCLCFSGVSREVLRSLAKLVKLVKLYEALRSSKRG